MLPVVSQWKPAGSLDWTMVGSFEVASFIRKSSPIGQFTTNSCTEV